MREPIVATTDTTSELGADVGGVPSVHDAPANGATDQEPQTAAERARYYLTPEFRRRLLDHLFRAKKQALTDLAEANSDGRT
jgi:hypothetical protein